jgi:hypothetical protein
MRKGLSLFLVLALCTIAQGQRSSGAASLANTTWQMSYRISRSDSWSDYGQVEFLPDGRIREITPTTGYKCRGGKWKLVRQRLHIEESNVGAEGDCAPTLVKLLDASIQGRTMTGTAELGMNPRAFQVRLAKLVTSASPSSSSAPREGSRPSIAQSTIWVAFWNSFRAAVSKRDRGTLKAMMLTNFAWTFQEYFQGERRVAFFKNLDDDRGSGWRALNNIIAKGTIVDAKSTSQRPARITPPPKDCGACEDCQAYFEFRDGRWLWISFYGCGDLWREHWANKQSQ